MISKIKIQNFKSIPDLEFEPGRYNVLIGENGCGKSNILEAIAMGGAAASNKLNRQFLVSRGIRISKPELMRAGFRKTELRKPISVGFDIDLAFPLPNIISFHLQNSNTAFSEWYDLDKEEEREKFKETFNKVIKGKDQSILNKLDEKERTFFNLLREQSEDFPSELINDIIKNTYSNLVENEYYNLKYDTDVAGFTIYSPENTFLRRFEDEETIQPLGIKGEGLFKLIKVFTQEKYRTSLNQLKKYLHMIDWFEDFEIPKKTFEGEKIINLKDRFIDEQIFIQQQNANEGFLFLLFYLSLFISKDTPTFFAIDNIEASFNPRLCTEIVKVTNELAKKKKKQVIITTHNPYILDGLDLSDDQQRLFVVRRNAEGKTIMQRIKPNQSKRKLSEAWMLGYIGGLPNNF